MLMPLNDVKAVFLCLVMFKESAANSGASDDVHFDGDDSDAPGSMP
jgi:hypothetical protein